MLRTLLAPNPSPMTLDGTRTFVVGREAPVVIDPGPELPAHVDAILAALDGRTPLAILLTHAHADHAAAGPALAARTGAPLMLRAGSVLPLFHPRHVDHWLHEGDEIGTDAGPVRAVATPGHAPEHVAFLWTGEAAPDGGALFVGDLLMGEGDTTLVAPPEGDLGAYLRSLDRVEALAPGVLYPTHGPALADPPAALARYRAHRTARIEQVVSALRRHGPARPDALVDAVYGGETLHPRLREAAAGSLVAILEHLQAAGRAAERPDGTFTLVSA